MKWTAVLGLLAACVIAACDPCAGTPSCRTEPELSESGQFIERPSGAAVPGVVVKFVRRGGATIVADTVRAVSDGDGFFVLRSGAFEEGVTVGDLMVTPPAPHRPYIVRGIRVETHGKRGDGGYLGRLFVNPWLQFIAELHDRRTDAQVAGATVHIRPLGPAIVEPAVSTVMSAENGRFMWEPTIVEFNALVVEFEVSAPGYPRAYRFQDTIPPQYRDEPPRFIVLKVGGGWSYAGSSYRRGTYQFLPGVTIQFTRTGGIETVPGSFTVTPNEFGIFPVPMEPVGDGTVVGDVTITPPSPLQPEVFRNVELSTFDGGKVRVFGPFNYGAAAIARPVFLSRATGLPVRAGTWARFTQVGGLSGITPAPWTVPDDGIRIIDSTGTVGYDAATPDTGVVVYEVEVRLNAPEQWDTVRVTVPARFSDTPAIDTFRVGSAAGIRAARRP